MQRGKENNPTGEKWQNELLYPSDKPIAFNASPLPETDIHGGCFVTIALCVISMVSVFSARNMLAHPRNSAHHPVDFPISLALITGVLIMFSFVSAKNMFESSVDIVAQEFGQDFLTELHDIAQRIFNDRGMAVSSTLSM